MSAAPDLDRTQRVQRETSDPTSSAWVVANAGSGKTYVLAQRVLRLLLAGVDPAAILCLTFTKVAAAEMSRRIFGVLAGWTTLPDASLRAELEKLGGASPSREHLREARRLFAKALETPGGLKIQTIHAFCERLLHQFPFEANVPGQFAVLDETSAAALTEAARESALAAAAREPDGRLGRAMRYLAEHASDVDIGKALTCVIAEREMLRRWIELSAGEAGLGGVDDALADLRRRLGLQPGDTEEAICKQICSAAGWGRDHCHEVIAALDDALASQPMEKNQRIRDRLAAIATAGHPLVEAEARLDLFLRVEVDKSWRAYAAEHRFKSHRFGADFGKANSAILDRFEAESERLLALAEKRRAARNLAATEALLVVGDAILQSYGEAKKRAGFLDFGDLIVKTRNLLSRADAAEWVLYKLDARIEHVLVDEAQDTSPEQWDVVKAIAADFFSGLGASERVRTVFAVGDDKQSIFGFQGAAPEMLAEMAAFFDTAATSGGARFVSRPLSLSFRSTTEVLDAVDRVFSGDRARDVTASSYEAHSAFRHDHPGAVVVMPRMVRPKGEAPESWTEPFDAPTGAEVALAEQIADEIGRLMGTALPSGKIVRPGGILILTRKRDAFVSAMNRTLRTRGIRAAGADRIPVATHIAVLDLLALADVMLLAEDELQLAACLKSPILGLDEEALMRLALDRNRANLWAALMAAKDEPFATAAERLRRWRAMADQVTPFRFFATVLGPDGGRRALRARLGGEGDDVLDAFLGQALAYEAIEPPSLQGFVAYLRAGGGDIKREPEAASAGVRLMTVHGAKGLEADMVFLVDTGSQIVVPMHRPVLTPIGGKEPAFLWRRSGNDVTSLQQQADLIADAATRKDYLRLLYVAMTRASDVLYVCGIRPAAKEIEGCWYSLVREALVPEAAERNPETGELAAPVRWPEPARPPRQPEMPKTTGDPEASAAPDWLSRPAAPPPAAPRPLRPSQALGEPDLPPPAPDTVARGPSDLVEREGALRRGRLIHRLLQILPGVPEAERRSAGERLLAREAPGDAGFAAAALAEAEAVLGMPELAGMFGAESRAEVALVGEVATARGPAAVSGQIDRLARDAAGWRILDFKTNRIVPATLAEADPAYILQLALYRRLLMQIDPARAVAAGIVWTARPKIMPIPAAAMERALADLGVAATGVP